MDKAADSVSLRQASALLAQALAILDAAKIGLTAAPHIDLALHCLAAEAARLEPPIAP